LSSLGTLGQYQPVIPGVAFIRCLRPFYQECRRVTNFRFRACSTCRSRSQAGLCVCTSCPISIRAKPTLINSSVTFLEENAPFKLPTKHCLNWVYELTLPNRLVFKISKMAVSLTSPPQPKSRLQPLTTTLRIQILKTIPSCSKASGVFSSRYRYPASSRESHFHRACL